MLDNMENICNFCSTGKAKTKCINCGCYSCGKNIYCCQIIQNQINENSVLCNMCYIEISHKLKPYKPNRICKKYKKCKKITDIPLRISILNDKLKSVDINNGQDYKKSLDLRKSLMLIDESSRDLLKIPLMNI